MSLEERRDFIGRCTRCSQCKFVPTPASQRFASACPAIDYGHFHSYSGSGKLIGAYGLLEGRADYTPELVRSLTVCTMCGNCDTSCKVNLGETVEPLDTLYAMRAHLAKAGKLPEAYESLIKLCRTQGTSQKPAAADQACWADGLGLVDACSKPCEVLIHVGTLAAADRRMWPGMRAAVQAMRMAGVEPAWLGASEGSSGSLAFDLGYVDDARCFAEALAAKIRNSGARRVVTFSAHAYAAFRNVYPRLQVALGDVDVLHISTWLAANKPSRPRRLDAVATYHDPCKLGRLSEPYTAQKTTLGRKMNGIYVSHEPQALRFGNCGEYEAPRKLLKSIEGLELVEMERNRASAYCCGAGGGAPEAYPDFAEFAAYNRLEEALATGASLLVTSCAGCTAHLGDIAKARNLPIRVVGLLSLFAEIDGATQP